MRARFSAWNRGRFVRGGYDAVREHAFETVVLSGGVFQNELLLEDLKALQATSGLEVWTNRAVPPNDGGISLGQAALAAFAGRMRVISCMNYPSQ